jgi:murein L,D-transpeptidase YcbB/YkuD
VANPGKFAAVLLAEDQVMPQAEIDKLLATGHDSEVTLKTPLPVHTTYFTAAVGADGKLKAFNDVYKLEAVVKKALGKDLQAQEPTQAAAPRTGGLADSTPRRCNAIVDAAQ